ncbi:MAG: toxic anion resistance protein [Propionibacteriaceae bacterium]|nr:toxic anion resistance protein [Propionibacteriaceae bacterium]
MSEFSPAQPTPPAPPAPQVPEAAASAAAPAATAMQAPILTLEAPAPMEVVATTQAPAMAPQVEAAQVPILDEKVAAFLAQIEQAETKSPQLAAQADAVRAMGDADIRKAAEASNRLLTTPVRAMKEGGLSQGSTVGKTLMDLRRTVEDLDPHQDQGFTKKLFGLIPMGRSVENYFRKYQSSQDHLNAILHALRSGQDELTRDNVSLGMEKQNLWQTMGRLNQYVYIAERLDAQLAARISELAVTDPERAKVLSEDVLFYVRQKHQDLLTQLAVSIQNYLSIDIIVKNNIELIKGVDRASTTTVAALRTAVIVAQALNNQRLVLDQITALNTTTSGLIQRTSEMLKEQSVSIQEQAASSTIGLEQLQAAFSNIYETMDSIDTFKAQALNNMSQTITVLEGEVAKSRVYLDRVQNSPQPIVEGQLSVDTGA